MAINRKIFQLAIDGPSGVGKSSTASLLAENLKFIRIDSGTLYRAITFIILEIYGKLDAEIMELHKAEISALEFAMNKDGIYYNGQNIKPHLKKSQIDKHVTIVARYPYVREKIKAIQHITIDNMDRCEFGGVIIDGRDIGTVILPDADLKIFLTAKEDIRALRRWNELGRKGAYEDILSDMKRRDYEDIHREIGPLKQAKDAIVVDNTEMNLEQQVDEIERLVYQKMGNK